MTISKHVSATGRKGTLFRKEQNKMLEFIFEKIRKILDWSGASGDSKLTMDILKQIFGDLEL